MALCGLNGCAHERKKARPVGRAYCALGRIRTCNLLIRSQVLYPLSHERLP